MKSWQRPAHGGAQALAPDALRQRLERVVGPANVRGDAGALVTYSRDATPLHRGAPDLVVFPENTEEVAAVLRIADEARAPVIPRGAGTNLSGGTIALSGGIVLALTRMNRLLEIDVGDLVAVCQPGVRTAQLAEAAAAKGLLFPASSPEEADELLQARRAVLPSLSRLERLMMLEDATVPRSRIAEMVAHIQSVARRYDLKIGTFGMPATGTLR